MNRLGWTALHEAIVLGDGGPAHVEVVELLVEAGADVNLPGNGQRPLAQATARGYDDIAAALRDAGAPPDGSVRALSPAHIAFRYPSEVVLRVYGATTGRGTRRHS